MPLDELEDLGNPIELGKKYMFDVLSGDDRLNGIFCGFYYQVAPEEKGANEDWSAFPNAPFPCVTFNELVEHNDVYSIGFDKVLVEMVWQFKVIFPTQNSTIPAKASEHIRKLFLDTQAKYYDTGSVQSAGDAGILTGGKRRDEGGKWYYHCGYKLMLLIKREPE